MGLHQTWRNTGGAESPVKEDKTDNATKKSDLHGEITVVRNKGRLFEGVQTKYGQYALAFVLADGGSGEGRGMFCLRLGRLCRRKLCVSRLGAILGPADDYPECNSHAGARPNQPAVTEASHETSNSRFGQTLEARIVLASILGLETFERFVFVMSVLEKYSDQDCSVLLGRSRHEIGEARMRALLHIAESDRLRTVPPSACNSGDPKAQTPEVQLNPQFSRPRTEASFEGYKKPF